MIETLFGSKTRVKLLYLFLNNANKPFYVREITRKIDEQINSVRRELANMLKVGIITCDSVDNKLFYQVNQRYKYYLPLRSIFGDPKNNVGIIDPSQDKSDLVKAYRLALKKLDGVRLAIVSGVLVQDSTSSIDVLLVGDMSNSKVRSIINSIERAEGRDVNYSLLSYEDFIYRLSIRDKFISEILGDKYDVIIDKDNTVIKKEEPHS